MQIKFRKTGEEGAQNYTAYNNIGRVHALRTFLAATSRTQTPAERFNQGWYY